RSALPLAVTVLLPPSFYFQGGGLVLHSFALQLASYEQPRLLECAPANYTYPFVGKYLGFPAFCLMSCLHFSPPSFFSLCNSPSFNLFIESSFYFSRYVAIFACSLLVLL